ncbi:allene oxide synthase, chloroplastic-like [Cryptomeria japonica]|uniref:allene oxide synthase, chloroplastic-like n=1 Tax=Cryptomeria japonica TaxID=3369 RepID=UPI0027DA6A21|nr:allene oxide synthase, chloroplastic-like [Cryptomeria japonica]
MSGNGVTSSKLPLRPVPGSYGPPILGPLIDRLNYFWFQGPAKFFTARMNEHKSTVFRTNMPPGPPGFCNDPRVVMLLDAKSFAVLFDNETVKKRNVFTGTFMPSVRFNGGYRVLPYLDPSEVQHTKLKGLCFELLKTGGPRFIPEFHSTMKEAWETIEKQIADKKASEFNDLKEQTIFNFLCRSMVGKDPREGPDGLGNDGPGLADKWVLFQVAPVVSPGLPHIIEELFLHSFRLPSVFVNEDHDRLYGFFNTHASGILDVAETRYDQTRSEACENLMFFVVFNSYFGFSALLPSIIKYVGAAGAGLHKDLAMEVRTAVQANGGHVSLSAVESMELVKSTIYEVLRMEPPVVLQYGRAKRDFVLESHDAAFEIKKGELLGGFQPIATRDPKVFENPDEFVATRFIENKKVIKYVLWSNGFETDDPTVHNKQCPGKNLVVLVARLFVVELFLRYDTFEVEVKGSGTSSKISFTSLTKATY